MNEELLWKLDRAFTAKYAQRRRLLTERLRLLSARGTGRIAPEQARIILILSEYHHGISVGDIISEMDLPYANVSRTIERLERKGLVRRTQGKEDGRQVMVHLTLEGGKLPRQIGAIYRETLSNIWGVQDIKTITALLTGLSQQ